MRARFKLIKIRRGDTLIEVTIALAILSLLLALGTVGAITAYRNAVQARERSIALNLAQRQADAVRAYVQSMTWQGFIGQSTVPPGNSVGPTYSMGGGLGTQPIIKNFGVSGAGYKSEQCFTGDPNVGPRPAPNSVFDPANLTSNASDGTDGLTYLINHQALLPSVANMFYMTLHNNSDGTISWMIANNAVDSYPAGNPLFYLSIVPNKAITCNFGGPSNDLLRFDVVVRWKSAIGGVLEESSLVFYLSRSETVSP